MADYPEHERMAAIREQSQAIGEFLEWAQSKGWRIVETAYEWQWIEPWNQPARQGPPTPPDLQGYRFWRGAWRRETRNDYGHYREFGFEARPRGSIQDWLAEFFDIDLDKLEEEKRTMLDKVREAQSI